MSQQDRKIEPRRFDPASGAGPGSNPNRGPNLGPGAPSLDPSLKPGRGRGGPLLMILALLVLVALVVFWLPGRVGERPFTLDIFKGNSGSNVGGDVGNSATPRTPLAELDVSPWSDAQLARQRRGAQEVLAGLLEQQSALEALQVERWAAADFDAAQQLAASGDDLYRQLQFVDATARYQAGLDAMEAIAARVDDVFESTLRAGEEHLAGEGSESAQSAQDALQLALVLRPDSSRAQAAMERALVLPQLLELLREAVAIADGAADINTTTDTAANTATGLDQAAALLEQALALDPQHPGAQAQLERVRGAITRRDFQGAMSAGYRALEQQLYDDAERHFLNAQSILPAAAEAETALLQARSERTQARIDTLAQGARAAEADEDWRQASESYQGILDIDDSVVFARAGLIQAQTRATLDRALQAAIDNPERLGDESVYQQARVLHQQAVALQQNQQRPQQQSQQQPRLRDQVRQLGELLRLAVIPVPVTLQSDNRTEVTVLRVARLGAFRERQLELKPGTYTAVGVRDGYRDVRLQFTVRHSQPNPAVVVSCTERI